MLKSRGPLTVPLVASLCFGMLLLAGCSNVEKAPPQPRQANLAPVERDVPTILRGTVASEAILLGFEDVVAHGYGLVVGLNSTGDRMQPPNVRSHMLVEMTRRGIGSERYDFPMGPEQMLRSPDTAVVIVEAIVPQGAPKGTPFDVRVYALPNSDATSLEGGILYTTELRPVVTPGRLPPVGSKQASAIAIAKGPVFTNPFANPDGEATVVNGRVGRILGGGLVIRDMPLKLKLPNPSHTRAKLIEQSINTYFPQEPGQRDPAARGESSDSIRINVPPSYRDRTREFAMLLQHTTINTAGIEQSIQQINRLVVENPASAEIASWRWQAFGRAVLPAIKSFYNHPDERPRLAALRAGARLDDPLVIDPLIDLAKKGSRTGRTDAIDLLADMRANPSIDLALRDLLDEDDIQVRLAAYDALAKRNSFMFITRKYIDGKFIVDLVESTKPLVYITQQREPRIVIFGEDLSIDRPATVSAWDNDFLLIANQGQERVDIRYHNERTGETNRYMIDAALEDFVPFLGHQTTIESPSPGLGLSYSQTVGLIHSICKQGYIQAPFMAEQDRILAQILDRARSQRVDERPEFNEDPDFREIFVPQDGFPVPTDPNGGTGTGLGRANSPGSAGNPGW